MNNDTEKQGNADSTSEPQQSKPQLWFASADVTDLRNADPSAGAAILANCDPLLKMKLAD